jgi:hypothetical protein
MAGAEKGKKTPHRYTVALTETQIRCILKAVRHAMPIFKAGPGTQLSAAEDLVERLGAAYVNRGSDNDNIHRIADRALLPKL